MQVLDGEYRERRGAVRNLKGVGAVTTGRGAERGLTGRADRC